ncbi:Hypothetical predicted protein [Podarcis lilfordi]|uniref:Uncharacterized protein n=1 Tax=Podarcis lilfordi TaxID=74358 RepID=A0AA35KNC6_9SAUR|nr:Hypothetical predicted protein [Podarcis lilfordi]
MQLNIPVVLTPRGAPPTTHPPPKLTAEQATSFSPPHRWIVPSTLAHRIKQRLPVNIGLFLKPEALNISLFISLHFCAM